MFGVSTPRPSRNPHAQLSHDLWVARPPCPATPSDKANLTPSLSPRSWDTTGQEEVGVWGAYFNASSPDPYKGELQGRAVESILAFMPSTPSFGYHGAAAGWGDFSNNGKWMVRGGWEREGGHYRAGLNSIPLAERYRSHPDDFYLLEVAMGGMTSVLGNIDASGAPSMAFHLYPFMLEYDPYSGDHGLGFFGHSMNVGAYAVRHASLGWLCFLCGLSPAQPSPSHNYTITPHDSFGVRAYVEPLGLWLVLQAGRFSRIDVNPTGKTVGVTVEANWAGGTPAAGSHASPVARLQLRTPALATGRRAASGFKVVGGKMARGAWEVTPGETTFITYAEA